MDKRVKFLEFGEFIDPIEKIARDYTTKGGSEQGLYILDQGAKFSKELEAGGEKKDIQKIRESIRRSDELDPQEIVHLGELAEQVGEESYSGFYILMELVQAAAVASSDLFRRTIASESLAKAAIWNGEYERARYAYNDAIEGLQILNRFFSFDRTALSQIEQGMRANVDTLNTKSDVSHDVFDVVTDDPATEWMELIRWNSDEGPNAGLAVQADPTFRLVLRWEYWTDQKRQLIGSQAREMVQQCETRYKTKNSMVSQRYLITIGDALAEMQVWQEAVLVYERILESGGEITKHPIGLHALTQCAYCHLKAGNLVECKAWLDRFPRTLVEKLSTLVITVAAEYARFLAVEEQYRCKCGQPPSKSAQDKVFDLFESVSIIAKKSPSNRLEYLRTLFFTVLARDLEIIRSG